MANNTEIISIIQNAINTNGVGAIKGAGLQNVLIQMVNHVAAGLSYAGSVGPTSEHVDYDRNVFWLATAPGTYVNFGNLEIPYGLTVIRYDGTVYSCATILEIEQTITQNSPKLITSGGVYAAIQNAIAQVEVGATEIYDISAANAVSNTPKTYATLALALADVPSSYQRGGISVKFIDSTVSKYVQYRLTSSTWNTTAGNWEQADKVTFTNAANESDLNFCDEQFNTLMSLKNGHVKTKNFDSSKSVSQEVSDSESDLQIVDENGNVLVCFEKGHIRTKNFNSSDIILPQTTKNNLQGKRVAFLGDSITQRSSATSQANTYHGVFCQLYGAIDRTAELYEETGDYILGINGTCIAANTKNGQNANRFVTRATAENFADSKLIVVFGGTNDLSYDIKPIGDLFVEETITATGNMGTKKLTAPTDTETFAGALHELIQTIQEVCPLVPIVLMTPLKRDHNAANNPDYITCNANGDYMIDFVNAIKEIGAFYGIPVLDLYSNSNLNPLAPSGSSIFGDGLHPNNKGHEIIGHLLYRFVEENVVIL